jgi:FkbM family methyltransferase
MKLIINSLAKIEYLLSILQGKGFGAARISLKIEAKNAISFLNSSKKPIIFDIGGNVGEYSERILNLNSDSQIIIFEPSKKNYIILNKKFKKYKNIKIENLGVSNKNGFAKLYHNIPGSPLASLYKRSFLGSKKVRMNGFEKIRITKIKNYMDKNNIKKIDLIKLDVEGYELECLKSLENRINKVKVIQFEFGGCNIDTRSYFRDFWIFFNNNKFDLYRITPFNMFKLKNYSENYENFLTTNFIAVNRNPNV